MLRIYSLIICLFTLYSCQTAKIDATPKQIQLQKEFAETTSFKIISNWANPLPTASMNALASRGLTAQGGAVGRIDISQNGNHLIIDGSKVDVVLPYFGERQTGVGFNSSGNNGINYQGDVENLKVKFNEKKKLYLITFDIKKNTESFNVSIELFQSLSTRININSSHRTSISYDGKAEELPDPKEEQ